MFLGLLLAYWLAEPGPGTWLQGPGVPGSSACALVFGAGCWALWWAGLYPGEAMGSDCPKAACLLVGGAVSTLS